MLVPAPQLAHWAVLGSVLGIHLARVTIPPSLSHAEH